MGYIRHHAIVVTGWDESAADAAHAKATELFKVVSPITPVAINGYVSFFVPPDGSKEHWPDSETGDEARAAFITWLRTRRPAHLDWIEVQYGDDNRETKIVSHSDDEFNDT